MKQLQGLGVFPQLTIGPVYVFRPATCDVTAAHITEPENEYARFDTARRQAKAELHQLYQKTLDKNGEESAAIFDIHQLMLDDADYLQSVRDFIYNDTYNAAYAVEKTGEKWQGSFHIPKRHRWSRQERCRNRWAFCAAKTAGSSARPDISGKERRKNKSILYSGS